MEYRDVTPDYLPDQTIARKSIAGGATLRFVAAITASLFLISSTHPENKQSSNSSLWQGNWVGSFTIGQHYEFLSVHLCLSGETLQGTFSEKIESDSEGTLSGKTKQTESRGEFHLLRYEPISAEQSHTYKGAYRSKHRLFAIESPPDDPSRLRYLDYTTGRHGVIFPLSERTFFAGPGYYQPYPPEIRIEIEKSSNGITGLIFHSPAQAEIRASKINFKEEEVSFRNEEVLLSGTLLIPVEDKPPYPAIVLNSDI
jgi:hypothetical protein